MRVLFSHPYQNIRSFRNRLCRRLVKPGVTIEAFLKRGDSFSSVVLGIGQTGGCRGCRDRRELARYYVRPSSLGEDYV